MTLRGPVILNPSFVTLNEVKSLRASSVNDLWQSDPLPKIAHRVSIFVGSGLKGVSWPCCCGRLSQHASRRQTQCGRDEDKDHPNCRCLGDASCLPIDP